MSDKVRVNVYLKPEIAESLKGISEHFGVSLSGAATLAIIQGVAVLSLVQNPKFGEMMEAISENLEVGRGSDSGAGR